MRHKSSGHNSWEWCGSLRKFLHDSLFPLSALCTALPSAAGGAGFRVRGKVNCSLRGMIRLSICLATLVVHAPAADQPPWPRFADVTDQAGIRFKHSLGGSELSNIVEGTGPGGMFFDYDNDGLLDIYFVNGCWHRDISDNRGRRLRGTLTNALYRNKGDGTFVDVTEAAGVGDKGYGMSACAADYDNDGDLDLYLLNYGLNVFYRNNGDGTFSNVTGRTRLGDSMWSVSATWLDFDEDGDLDVYVANYLEYDKGKFEKTGAFHKAENYPGPLSYSGRPNHLYRNNGDGTFSDVTEDAGVHYPNGRTMSVVAFDFDRDGDVDLFVTNDAMSNTLWVNQGDGRFEEKALEHGVAFGEGGQGASSMGPVVGDVDRNGLVDILIPDMGYGCLLLQDVPGFFVDMTAQSRLAQICGQYTGWGAGLIDFDNDGYLDVFIANGNAHHLYSEEAVLARNDGKGRFEDTARKSGDYFSRKYVARGATFGDYDNDGDMDILVFNINDRPCLLRNDGGNGRNWLKVVPKLESGGLTAIGTFVTVQAGGLKMVSPVLAVNGYLSSFDPRPHFGLGSTRQADWVEVEWPDGKKQRMENVPANQILEVNYNPK